MHMSCAKSVCFLSKYCMQIRLPKSAGDALMSQDAPKNGAMLFELSTSAGRSLHAGVLDFSAAQGTVGVPEHLIRNLWGLTTGDGQCHGHVIVTYKKLPKGIADALSNVAKRCIAMLQHNRLHWSVNHKSVPLSVCRLVCRLAWPSHNPLKWQRPNRLQGLM